jgi:enamine deaminase RidA (YjgF/YER057c/UK114 family)
MKVANCPCVKMGLFFLAGILTAIGFQAWLSWSPQAVAGAGPSPEERISKLKLKLPEVTEPTNTLVNAVRVGDLIFVSGTGPGKVNGKEVVGRLGMFPEKQQMTVKQGQAAARLVGLQILSVVKQKLGSLDKVRRLVKTFGMVNASPEFKQHPQVINGFSDLMVEVFGPEAGKGTRSAVGMSSLPGGIPVEIEAIFEVR